MLTSRASAPQVAVPEGEGCPAKEVCLVVEHLADELVVADGEVVAIFLDAVAAMSLKNVVGLLDGGDFFHLRCVWWGLPLTP